MKLRTLCLPGRYSARVTSQALKIFYKAGTRDLPEEGKG